MSTNELILTLVGWVATEPKRYTSTGAGTTAFTSFRMASTRRYFDRAAGVWVDGRTEWFTVKAWRQQAYNVAASLRKSDPVIVQGRLVTEEWTGPDGPRTTLVLEAAAIGPDLTYGEAKFARTVHVAAGGAADQQDATDEPPGDPADESTLVGEPARAVLTDDLTDDLNDDLAGVP
ncbi:single-stranded DNA-binding protein [Pengzhenrongella frigida]|nr:single-stranded DNA-binding protein [Cellulomonas sp. HLT2-17]